MKRMTRWIKIPGLGAAKDDEYRLVKSDAVVSGMMALTSLMEDSRSRFRSSLKKRDCYLIDSWNHEVKDFYYRSTSGVAA